MRMFSILIVVLFCFRDYTNPSLPVNPSAIDATGQVNYCIYYVLSIK